MLLLPAVVPVLLGAVTATQSVLAGQPLAVASSWLTLLAAAVIFLRYRVLLFTTFDPEVAEASGVRTGVADAVLLTVLALSILATMQVLGVTLIAAALVIPATVARMSSSDS